MNADAANQNDRLRQLLAEVRSGARSIDDAVAALRTFGAEPASLAPAAEQDLGFAVLDHERQQRCGLAEVVFCQGKSADQVAQLAVELSTRAERVLMTRATPEQATAVRLRLPNVRHDADARCLVFDPHPLPARSLVAVLAAGTADRPVAAEAVTTLGVLGVAVETFTDVGVAGLHRLLRRLPAIRRAQAIVAVAGMDGALPTVVAGLVARPVIAVPTSVGYGASFGGLAALLTMLNACAAGVAVVNVDNGFGAGYLAAQIALTGHEPQTNR